MTNFSGAAATSMHLSFSGSSLEEACIALAEGEHDLGTDATRAGYMVACAWPGIDCPWFVPHPEHLGDCGLEVAEIRLEEIP